MVDRVMSVVHEDDTCPVCQLLLYEPVTTGCNHTLCKSCMSTWADVSANQSMTMMPPSDQDIDFTTISGIEARCPMCRTYTEASLDEARCLQIQEKYPRELAERAVQELEDDEQSRSTQIMTLYIGNHHSLIPPSDKSPDNRHEWTFFIKPSRRDIIEEVQIFLHPTFRPSRIVRQRPPYEIRRSGWGVFEIQACVILKAGYSWASSNAEDSPDGASQGMLRLDWMLTFDAFDGVGAMGRCRLKGKNDRDWEEVSDEEERDIAEWNRAIRQYQNDASYVPPTED